MFEAEQVKVKREELQVDWAKALLLLRLLDSNYTHHLLPIHIVTYKGLPAARPPVYRPLHVHLIF